MEGQEHMDRNFGGDMFWVVVMRIPTMNAAPSDRSKFDQRAARIVLRTKDHIVASRCLNAIEEAEVRSCRRVEGNRRGYVT